MQVHFCRRSEGVCRLSAFLDIPHAWNRGTSYPTWNAWPVGIIKGQPKSIVSAVSMTSYPHGRHSAQNPTRNPLRRRAFYHDLKHLLDRYWSRLVTHGPLGERHGKKQNREACCLRPIRGR